MEEVKEEEGAISVHISDKHEIFPPSNLLSTQIKYF